MFIPTTMEEVAARGWDALDVILVSGDTYIDSSYNGSAVIGHWLIENGFRVGIIAQPDIESEKDITRLGMPELFWGVSAGCVDSLVANYAPTGKFRKDDDFTPGGVNDRRPDRACIAYTNLIKKYANGKPVVLGGIEASLRRITHYDAWSDGLRKSILFDSKADIITYGMAETATLKLAQAMRDGDDWHTIRGICYIAPANELPLAHSELPSYESCVENTVNFSRMYKQFYYNCDPSYSRGLIQRHGDRYLVQNPPSKPLTTPELDRIYEMDFENEVHPYYAAQGYVKAIDTIKNSVTTHRGCYGECNFCAIAIMQGRTVISRSEESILRECRKIASKPGFDGVFRDIGGPTANMYGFECPKKEKHGACLDKRCMYPKVCGFMPVDHTRQINLLKKISEIEGVKHVFVASGIRYDLINKDKEHGEEYLRSLIRNGHISGQMKVAPEHVSDDVLKLMGKPGKEELIDFKEMFDRIKDEEEKDLYLTYYLMAAHPGCEFRHMGELLRFCSEELMHVPEQVQIFTPTPSTVSTAMYFTRRDWQNQKPIKVERRMDDKQHQKDILLLRDMPRMPDDTPRERKYAPLKKNDQISFDTDAPRTRDGRISFAHKGAGNKYQKISPKKEREEYLSHNKISEEQIAKKKKREEYLRMKSEQYDAEVNSSDIQKRVFVRDAEAEDRYHERMSGGQAPSGDRPRREGGRPPRRDGDRPPRRDGDRPPRRDGDRPPRRYGDRPPRRDGDRPPRRDGDRPPRRDGDRPPRRDGDRPPRRDGDRLPRRDGDRPPRREGGRDSGNGFRGRSENRFNRRSSDGGRSGGSDRDGRRSGGYRDGCNGRRPRKPYDKGKRE